MWNDDYFEFLVKVVWKLDRPIKIIDFGCGYGFLGLKLLPLLPRGSSYTGLDTGEALLQEARGIYEQLPYRSDFLLEDITAFTPKPQYDLAICQSVLRHLPDAVGVLKRMIDAVVPGGLVICIEPNRAMEEAGFYSNGTKEEAIDRMVTRKQRWDAEQSAGGRDYQQGIKVPVYMQELGLEKVEVRINDFVELLDPSSRSGGENRPDRLELLFKERGIAPEGKVENIFAVNARCHMISYGYKSDF
jgi:SAM-dependent methyltransferase